MKTPITQLKAITKYNSKWPGNEQHSPEAEIVTCIDQTAMLGWIKGRQPGKTSATHGRDADRFGESIVRVFSDGVIIVAQIASKSSRVLHFVARQ